MKYEIGDVLKYRNHSLYDFYWTYGEKYIILDTRTEWAGLYLVEIDQSNTECGAWCSEEYLDTQFKKL